MPASLPGSDAADNLANPDEGQIVTFDLLSGPKGSPLDVRRISAWSGGTPTYANDAANQTPSTGGLSTGIGFGAPPIIGPTAPDSIEAAGFTDGYSPGASKLDGTAAADSTFMYIGGGKSGPISTSVKGIPFPTTPYTAGFGLGAAGSGGPRDAGAGPAFTGFKLQMVTAAADVANGAAVETGFNFLAEQGGTPIATLLEGQSVFGVASVASAAPA